MARVMWLAAGIVALLAPWYGPPVALRLSATAVVLTATLTWSLARLVRTPPGVVAAVVSLGASAWAWRTLGHSFIDAAADSGKVLFWTTVEVAGLAALGARLTRADARSTRVSGWLLLLPGAAVAVRLLPDAPAQQQLFLAGLGAAAVASGTLLGRYQRGLDTARTAAVDRARAQQRRALAADLHDYVAHDLAGIAVLAQSARMVPGHDPAQSIAHIEQAALRALRQLDHSIALLRDDTGRPLRQHGLADIAELVAACPLAVELAVSVYDTDDIPAAVQSTAHRLIAEALTNVTRHARHARRVVVSVTRHEHHLGVVVVNDLPPQAAITRPAPAGTGLDSLRERVAALGGDLRAGIDQAQWRVTATLPLH